MVRKRSALLPLFALLLGALAVAFSFVAYIKRIKAKDVSLKSEMLCVYPSSPSCALGIIAAIFLLAEQIVISVATNCFCCCGVRCSLRCTAITSLVLFVSSWSTFVIAFMGLIYTAILNNTSYLTKAYPGNNGKVCNVGNAALFLGTACWCIISTGVGLISYAFWVCGVDGSNNDSQEVVNQEQGVSMGKPHMPPAQEQC